MTRSEDSAARALAARVERARALRPGAATPPAPDTARGLFAEVKADLERTRRRLHGVGEAWAGLCPAELAARTSLVGLTRGVLTVAVTDAGASFEIDRLLRGGMQAELIRRCAAPVRTVKIVVRGG